jgi:DNA-binding NarL/FixJ family response regulator
MICMITILIADDHDVVRRGLRAILETRPGWRVVDEARDGKEAVANAFRCEPDIAIIDYGLPQLNGIEAARQIRHHLPSTEILIFTMHSSDDILLHALEAGARGFLSKSDAGDYLIAAVQALSRHKPFFTGKVSETLIASFLAASNAAPAPVLTMRENSVVQLIAEGRTSKEAADLLCVSPKTVEASRASALRKLNLKTTADLIRYAVRNKLVDG